MGKNALGVSRSESSGRYRWEKVDVISDHPKEKLDLNT